MTKCSQTVFFALVMGLVMYGSIGCEGGKNSQDTGGVADASDVEQEEISEDDVADTFVETDSESSDTSTSMPDSVADGGRDTGTGDAVGDGTGGEFSYPDGEPNPGSVYMKGECLKGFCEEDDQFGSWQSASVETCNIEEGVFTVEAQGISGDNSSFTLQFAAPESPRFQLGGEATTVDWTLSDGASAFLFFDGDQQPVDSTGTVHLETCGKTVAGRFDVQDLCEYHSCSTNQASVTGAFRCSPSRSMPCGK